MVLPFGDQKMLDGLFRFLSLFSLASDLLVALEMLASVVPGFPDELSRFNQVFSFSTGSSVVSFSVGNETLEVVSMFLVASHVFHVLLKVLTESSTAFFQSSQDSHGLRESSLVPLSNLGVLILVKSEPKPLVGLLPPGVKVLSDFLEGKSVLLEGGSDGLGLLSLSPGPVEVKSVQVALLAPEPVPGNRNDKSAIPMRILQILIINSYRLNSLRKPSRNLEVSSWKRSSLAREEKGIADGYMLRVENSGRVVDLRFRDHVLDHLELHFRLDVHVQVFFFLVVGG